MASIKNSLRKIYTALGGNNSKSKTITGLLDDISTVASSGGGGTSTVLIDIDETYYDDGETEYSTFSIRNKTANEVVQLIKNGIPLTFVMHGDDKFYDPDYITSYIAGEASLIITKTNIDSNSILFQKIKFLTNGNNKEGTYIQRII